MTALNHLQDDTSPTAIGNRLAMIKRAYGLTQQQFADRIGVTQGAISGWLTGYRHLGLQSALVICDEFNVTLDYLYRGESGGLTVSTLNMLEAAGTNQ